ncbi:MAG: hypothetical protein LBF19_07375 [Prevotellaceae bacterium]|jgi:phage gpG-like protein|nr:hypothetical protein [Prevotellaceae bacterium]
MANTIQSINFDYLKENLLRDTARMAAIESVKFFKQSFRDGGFTDTALSKWQETDNPLKRKTMFNSGVLMDSVRATEESTKRVVVSSDTVYSAIHNEGGVITVTAQMKKYWWTQYMRFAGKVKTAKSGKRSQSKDKQKPSTKAEFCKRMALMKVGSKIKIPQRQFMGESQTLMSRLDEKLGAKIAEYWERTQESLTT